MLKNRIELALVFLIAALVGYVIATAHDHETDREIATLRIERDLAMGIVADLSRENRELIEELNACDEILDMPAVDDCVDPQYDLLIDD